MVHFRCCECGREFEEPKHTQEFHGDNYFYEDWLCCPFCGGEYEDIDEDEDFDDEDDSDEYEFDPRDADCESQ